MKENAGRYIFVDPYNVTASLTTTRATHEDSELQTPSDKFIENIVIAGQCLQRLKTIFPTIITLHYTW